VQINNKNTDNIVHLHQRAGYDDWTHKSIVAFEISPEHWSSKSANQYMCLTAK